MQNGETLCDAFIEAGKVLEQSKNVNGGKSGLPALHTTLLVPFPLMKSWSQVEATKQCVKSLLESHAALTALKERCGQSAAAVQARGHGN